MNKLREYIRRLLGSVDGRRLLGGVSMAAVFLMFAVAAHAGEHGQMAEASPEPAEHGAHGGGHSLHINWWDTDNSHAPPLGWFFIDFVIFAGGLGYLLRKPMREGFKKRHETIKNAIAEAQAAHTRAKAHHDEYQDKLQRIDEEVVSLVDGAKNDGAALRDKIVSDATSYAEGLRSDTGNAVEQELDDARRRLRRETVQAVLARAADTIEKELTDSDRARLLEEAIAALEDESDVTLQGAALQAAAGGAA